MANIFTTIKNAITNHRRERMANDIMAILKTQYSFDSYRYLIPQVLSDRVYYSKKIAEYLVWYSANGVALSEFYESDDGYNDSDKLNFYWHKAPNTIRRCHSGLANEISVKMDTIIFGNGYKFIPTVYAVDEEGNVTGDIDEKATEHAEELVNQFIEGVNLRQVCKRGCQAASWSGHIAIKLGFDFSLSKYPIPQIYDRRFFDLDTEKGITRSIIFHNYIESDNPNPNEQNKSIKFRHDEVYSTNEKGFGTIQNVLVMLKGGAKEQVIPWEKAGSIFEQFQDVEEIFTSKTKGMLAFDLPNLVESNIDQNDPYGVSDYANAISAFDYLDECYSALPRELRDKRFIRLIPEDRLVVNEEGERKWDDGFTTNYLKTRGNPNDGSASAQFEIAPDETANHVAKYNLALIRAINLCGLSPQSLGITGVDAVNNSDSTIREKSKATLETRNAKLELWKPFLCKLVSRMITFESEMQKMTTYVHEDGVPQIDIDWNNIDMKVEFGDYIETSINERITNWGTAKAQGIASLEECVKNLHPDWLQADIDAEVNRIKFEQGLSTDNPDNLMLDENTETENEEEETNGNA